MAENNDTKQQQQQILEEFREMVLAEKNLTPRVEDAFLLKFLRIWNFDKNKSLVLKQNYYKLRCDYSHLYKNFSLSSPQMQALRQNNMATILPQPDQHGRLISVVRLGNWDTTLSNFDDLFVSLHMTLEVIIEDNLQAQLNGIVSIIDFEGISFQHVKQFGPANINRTITLIERSMPIWFHQFHFVNDNAMFKIIYTLLLPFLTKSMRERIFLHGRNLESLYKHVNRDNLPQELGGLQPPLDNSALVEKLYEYEEYLQKLNSFGYKQGI
uniref:CRAL-TRIO domain-containing protein n=1 Tax=Strigamia maritima TaxID=126957 RepID=T1J3G5_STRMM